ncbi:MAG TPA: gamma-glutamyl-gamma-aminobutyrate hydrolase family protein [Candidatus Sumerlaeia bacterium]|nr:gamma-glutamyl-gamma-aminobutyrate hydrolase family protein [Candidatus Sumerlaeia bacterium]
MKPIIGINANFFRDDDENLFRIFISANYTNAILKSGGTPIILPVAPDAETIEQYLQQIDGLMFIGGADIDPALYGMEKKYPLVRTMSPERQNFDHALAVAAIAKDIPVLGICCGCQMLNVACGGTLIQDIEQEIPEARIRHYLKIPPYYLPHKIRISPDSLLYSILQKESIETNSAHHQCVLQLGEGIRPTAWSEDNIVECIERPQSRFFLGLQWHPEAIHERPEQLSLFKAFVEAAALEPSAASSS